MITSSKRPQRAKTACFCPNCVFRGTQYSPCVSIRQHALSSGGAWTNRRSGCFPIIGTAIFGMGSMLIIGIVVTYLIDILPERGSAGIALKNLCRQLFAAAAMFVTEPLTRVIGIGVLFSADRGLFLVTSVVWYLERHSAAYGEKYGILNFYALIQTSGSELRR